MYLANRGGCCGKMFFAKKVSCIDESFFLLGVIKNYLYDTTESLNASLSVADGVKDSFLIQILRFRFA